MTTIADRHTWTAARDALRETEARVARERAALMEQRRALPLTPIDASQRFTGPDGPVTLLDAFEGRRQLLAYRFWFESGGEPCAGCSLWISGLGDVANLHRADTTLAFFSPAPIEEIEAVRRQRGIDIPWYSMPDDAFDRAAGYDGTAQITSLAREGSQVLLFHTLVGSQLETVGNHWTLLELTPSGARADT